MATDGIKQNCIIAVEDIEYIDTSLASSRIAPDTDAIDIMETQSMHHSIHGSNVRKSEESNCTKSVASLAPEASPPVSEKTSKRKQIMKLEVLGHVILALLACMFLVFACLAASVDHTVPGSSAKYKPGAPLPELYIGPVRPNVTLLPNGSFSGRYFEAQENVPDFLEFPVSDLNLRLLEAAKLGPTLFPILFAAIVGSFLRLVARWRVETGSTVEELEFLVGSRSLASTVTTLFCLRTWGIIETGLVILWALSPIAGQASVRLLSSGQFNASTLTDPPWFATDITSVPIVDDNSRSIIQSRYITCLVNPRFLQDLSSGPWLPMIAANESWALSEPIPASESDNCTSLFGFDIIGPVFFPTPAFSDQQYIFGNDIVSFDYIDLNFTVSYFDFNCPSVTVESMDGPWLSILGPDLLHSNSSILRQQANSGSGFFMRTSSTSEPHSTGQGIFFGSFYGSQVTLWTCLLNVITRDIRVSCESGEQTINGNPQCRFLEGIGTATVSPITPFTNSTLADNVFGQWPLIDPASVGTSSLTEQYLAQGNNFTASHIDLSKVDNQTFSARLATIFNTYVQARQPASGDDDFSFNSSPITWLKSTSDNQVSFKPFSLVWCNWVWFAILTIASTILIVCASLNVWISHRLLTPDIMGYVSTLVQDHPLVHDTGTTSSSSDSLDGLERARLLKRVRVQIRDVGFGGGTRQFGLISDIKIVPKTKKARKYF